MDFLLEHGPNVAYLILLLGSFVEGESVVVTAGFLAFKGFLYFPYVTAIAFVGSTLADQLLFFLGRKYGPEYIKKRPKLQKRSKRAFELLHKHNLLFIMGFRFIYGIRTISPFVIGTSGITVKRFAILNVIAAAIWAVLSCGFGYMLGHFFAENIESAIEAVVRGQKAVLIVLVLGISILLFKAYRRRKTNLHQR